MAGARARAAGRASLLLGIVCLTLSAIAPASVAEETLSLVLFSRARGPCTRLQFLQVSIKAGKGEVFVARWDQMQPAWLASGGHCEPSAVEAMRELAERTGRYPVPDETSDQRQMQDVGVRGSLLVMDVDGPAPSAERRSFSLPGLFLEDDNPRHSALSEQWAVWVLAELRTLADRIATTAKSSDEAVATIRPWQSSLIRPGGSRLVHCLGGAFGIALEGAPNDALGHANEWVRRGAFETLPLTDLGAASTVAIQQALTDPAAMVRFVGITRFVIPNADTIGEVRLLALLSRESDPENAQEIAACLLDSSPESGKPAIRRHVEQLLASGKPQETRLALFLNRDIGVLDSRAVLSGLAMNENVETRALARLMLVELGEERYWDDAITAMIRLDLPRLQRPNMLATVIGAPRSSGDEDRLDRLIWVLSVVSDDVKVQLARLIRRWVDFPDSGLTIDEGDATTAQELAAVAELLASWPTWRSQVKWDETARRFVHPR